MYAAAAIRGIALSSLINMVIDLVILIANEQTLMTHVLQLVFKPNSSTSRCTTALKEIASYYMQRGENIFCTMQDTS